jgi:hypothetical protein
MLDILTKVLQCFNTSKSSRPARLFELKHYNEKRKKESLQRVFVLNSIKGKYSFDL